MLVTVKGQGCLTELG